MSSISITPDPGLNLNVALPVNQVANMTITSQDDQTLDLTLLPPGESSITLNVQGQGASNITVSQDVVFGGGSGSSLPDNPTEGSALVYESGMPKWKSQTKLVSDALAVLDFAPNVPTVSSTSVADQFVSGNVLSGATTLTGTLKVLNYTVPTISVPTGITYTSGVSSTTSPIGTFKMNQDGAWTLTPKLYSSGAMPTITFTVSNGLTTAVGSLNLNLTWVNHSPITNPDTVTTTQNTPLVLNLLANDTEPDGQSMTITKINSTNVTAGGSAVAITNGTVKLESNGYNVTVTPTNGFTGVITFTYTVSDTYSGGAMTSVGVVTVSVTSTSAAGTSNWLVGTSTLIPFNFAANTIAKNQVVVEPTSGATIKRITDVTQDLPGQVALYNAYSRYPTENITEEYAIAFAGNSTTSLIIDRSSGSVVATLAYDNTGLATHTIGAYHEVRWHYTVAHPYRVYYVKDQQFCMIDDVRNQSATRTVIKDFSSVINWGSTPNNLRKIYMDQEGNSSLDSDHWAWMAAYYDGSNWKIRAFIHYQVSTDTTHIMYPSGLTGFPRLPPGETTLETFRYKPNAVEMTPDGSAVLIMYERAYSGVNDTYIGTILEAPYIFPRDFNPATSTPFRVAADATHSGWSSVNGNWYFVCQDNRRDKWMAVPISGAQKGYGNEGYLDVNGALGAGVIDFHTDGGYYPGMHFGVCTNGADGWTLVSTYTTQTASTYGLGNALYMMQIAPEASAVKWHIAPTCNQFPAADKQDYNESPGSINLAGTRVYTCGDWNGTAALAPSGTERYVDLYSIQLPTNWRSHFTATAPSNTAVPTISGTQQQSNTLSYTPGTWTGYPTPTLSVFWQRDGVDISGATSTTYLLAAADVDHQIRVREQATNGSGVVNAYSAVTGTISATPAPINLTLPTITGTAQEGQVLTFTGGTWSNSPTSTSFDLLRDGIAIATNVSSTYIVVNADVGHTLSVRQNATNAFGTNSAISNSTVTVTASAGTITRIASAISTDPGGPFESSRVTPGFNTNAGDLIVVSVTYGQTGGNSISVTDTAGNSYQTQSAGSTIGGATNTEVKQFYVLNSAAKSGNVVTATQTGGTGGNSGLLDISVVTYRAPSGTWTKTASAVGGIDYAPIPMTTSSFTIANNSVAVCAIGNYYSNVAPVSTGGDTLVSTMESSGWTLERIRGTGQVGATFTTGDNQGGGYSREAYSVAVFTAA